ncbi:MAG TPA: hypothetical protein PK734_00920 [Bacteroidales bacterium]|nr:MAG: hypothetical protein BWY22_01023 [Bacteroidetes bacterium ADurb.Bin217]HPM12032.1 hypothetical protein [Bacteroidales bacterium]
MRHFLVFLIALSSSLSVFSQAETIKRVEFETENRIRGYIPMGTNGILQDVVDEAKNKADKKNRIITCTLYSTNLVKLGDVDVITPNGYRTEFTASTYRTYYNMGVSGNTQFMLHCVDIPSLKVTTLQGKMPRGTFIRSMSALDDYVIVKGDVRGNHLFFFKNVKTGEESISNLKIVSSRDFKILGYQADTVSNEFYVLYRDKVNNEIITVFQVYAKGSKTQEVIIKNDEGNYMQLASVSKTKDGSYIICGTVGNFIVKTFTTGIFICKIQQQKKVFIKYINYLDITNFTSYLSENKQERIEKKKDRYEQKGKELEINYLMAPHRIIESNNQYVLVGEAYYPTYRQVCHPVPNAFGGATIQCENVFDGYQYTHYFLCNFDQQGNLLWSNSKEMHIDYKPHDVRIFLDVKFTNGTLSTLHGSGFDFHYTVFDSKGNVTKTATNNMIETQNEADNITRSSMNTNYWYNNYFIAFGIQKIKNTDEKDKRKVNYLNKIQVVQ